jgi:hypothetical protein
MPGNKKKRNTLSDEIAIKLIKEYDDKLFYSGEKTVWYKTKAIMHNVSICYIVNLMYSNREKYLVSIE